MSTSLLDCRYYGRNPKSYFMLGQSYTLLVKQCWLGIIKITPTHPQTGKPMYGFSEQYRNLGKFLAVWQPMKCLEANVNQKVYYNAGG